MRVSRLGAAAGLAVASLWDGLLLSTDKKEPTPDVSLPPGWKQLGLTQDQAEQALKTRAAYKAKIDALRKQIEGLKKEEADELEKVLTKAQHDRLREIRAKELPKDAPKDQPPEKDQARDMPAEDQPRP
jgi:hypothetical protein